MNRPTLRRREVTIAANHSLTYDDTDWHDALVIIERGEVDLCCARGGRRRFGAGAVLFFQGLDLRELHNPGVQDAVLVAHYRRPTHQ